MPTISKEIEDLIAEMRAQGVDISDAVLKIVLEKAGRQSKTAVFSQGSQQVDLQVNIAKFVDDEDRASEEGASRRNYLTAVYRRTENLPLRGRSADVGLSGPNIAKNQQMRLNRTFVFLNTTASVENKRGDFEEWGDELGAWSDTPTAIELAPLSLLKAVHDSSRVVILGRPGSGKSTFCRYLALNLAAFELTHNPEYRNGLPEWGDTNPFEIPVLIYLREFDRWLKRRASEGSAELVWLFLEESLKALGILPYLSELRRDVQDGRAVVMFDGLDEVNEGKREIVKDSIAKFSESCLSRVVVTCRPFSYSKPKWQLIDFEHFEIAPLDGRQVQRFIDLWHEELIHTGVVRRPDAEHLQQRFREALETPDLAEMAPDPLLLSTMALVHTREGFLPQTKCLLLEECTDLLLLNWEQLRLHGTVGQEPMGIRALLNQTGLKPADFKQALWELTYNSFSQNRLDIQEKELISEFRRLHPERSWQWAGELITAMKERAGLLVETEPGTFEFPHKTFLEYYAALHLSNSKTFSADAAELARDPRWREVILLAVGRLVNMGDLDRPLNLVAQMLLPNEVTNDPPYGLFAGELLTEIAPTRLETSELGKTLVETARRHLTEWLVEGMLPYQERPRLGKTLSKVGDDRFDKKNLWLPKRIGNDIEGLAGFSYIGPSTFIMGVGIHAHEVTLGGYYIARYPVTEGQYLQFILETTKTPPAHWIHGRPRPERLNCPVVNVSWYDAFSYCRWLSKRLASLDLTESAQEMILNTDALLSLPTEAELERVCVGPVESDPNTYPWGHEFKVGLTNVRESRLGEPTAVGLFPEGKTSEGIYELGGNVLEWTITKYWDEERHPYTFPYQSGDGREETSRNDAVTRVIKGGSYHLRYTCAKCSYRVRNFPVDTHPYLGFRLVLREIVNTEQRD